MKVTISRLKLGHLWNNEYCMFVSQIVAIFLKYNSLELHLKKAFDRVMAFMPELAKIKAQELGNVISNQLADMNTERKSIMKGINDQVKTFGKLSLIGIAPHVEVLNRFLDKHGRTIGQSNYNDNTDKFNKLLADYDENVEIRDAVLALNLGVLFDQLRTVNHQFSTLYLKRTEENSAIETVDAHAIRIELDKALTAFFDTFEVFSTEYDTLDYKTPANELNDLIMHYKSQIKARITRRQEGKEVHTETPITEL